MVGNRLQDALEEDEAEGVRAGGEGGAGCTMMAGRNPSIAPSTTIVLLRCIRERQTRFICSGSLLSPLMVVSVDLARTSGGGGAGWAMQNYFRAPIGHLCTCRAREWRAVRCLLSFEMSQSPWSTP